MKALFWPIVLAGVAVLVGPGVAVIFASCVPPVSPNDASIPDGGRTPCQTDNAISASRLIRQPNGQALVLPPCDAGGP
jgi:hypothetical protein